MNSFCDLKRRQINAKKLHKSEVLTYYLKYYRDNNFIDACIKRHLDATFTPPFELPKTKKKDDLMILKRVEHVDMAFVVPENYTQQYVNGKPVYELCKNRLAGNKTMQLSLLEILISLLNTKTKYPKYLFYLVCRVATDTEIMTCIDADNLKMSDSNFAHLFDNGADTMDVSLVSNDGITKSAHGCILVLDSPLFKSVLACSDEKPVIVKLPFNGYYVNAYIKIIYRQLLFFQLSENWDRHEYIETMLTMLDFTGVRSRDQIIEHFKQTITK